MLDQMKLVLYPPQMFLILYMNCTDLLTQISTGRVGKFWRADKQVS